MKGFKEKSLNDRLSDKNAAKQALIRKLKDRPGPDDPAVQARMAERTAIAQARAERLAAKAAAAAAAAAAQAELERKAREAAEEAERALAAEKAAEEERQKVDLKLALEAAERRIREAREAGGRRAKR
jgi:hypothetical protein